MARNGRCLRHGLELVILRLSAMRLVVTTNGIDLCIHVFVHKTIKIFSKKIFVRILLS